MCRKPWARILFFVRNTFTLNNCKSYSSSGASKMLTTMRLVSSKTSTVNDLTALALCSPSNCRFNFLLYYDVFPLLMMHKTCKMNYVWASNTLCHPWANMITKFMLNSFIDYHTNKSIWNTKHGRPNVAQTQRLIYVMLNTQWSSI